MLKLRASGAPAAEYTFDIAPSFRQAIWTFKAMLTSQRISNAVNAFLNLGLEKIDYIILATSVIALLCVGIIEEKTKKNLRVCLDGKSYWLRYMVVLFLITAILTFGVYGPSYNSVDFVYAQF